MSFKASISDVLICNDALALLPEEPITSLAEQSLSARECRRAYKPCVAEMMEAYHWNLATKRVALAQIANDRAEWGFAYAKPTDMAYPKMMLWAGGGGAWGWTLLGPVWSISGIPVFEQVGDTIYTNIGAAVLEYTSFDITEADFTALFRRVIALELAARLCQPITKSSARMRELIAQSEGERQRIIANDLNRNRPTYGHGATESQLARFGAIGGEVAWRGGYPLDPVALPSNVG